ncbi:MAG: sugar ABC transporter ATP-binding protein [Eubacteriales bacterium]
MIELKLSNIVKTYPGVKALDDVSMTFKSGEVHAIVGENGAGKSTFIKIISGAEKPDSGTISINGEEYSEMNPRLAIEKGIAVVYQELIQLEALTVADNIFLGMNIGGSKIQMDDKELHKRTKELLDSFNCSIPSDALMRDLSIANRQVIEIAKAVVKKAEVIIMDEPTAAITVEEQKYLFENIRRLKKEGVTVIYISHRLEELFEICDNVSVLRDGKYITTENIEDTDKNQLISLMVGRDLSEAYPPKGPAQKEKMLRVENLSGNGLENINFELHKGEILGFAGLVGAGRTELMHLILGAEPKTGGKVYIKGKEVDIKSPSDALAAGIGIIPEDRKWQGCFIDKPIYWNVSISSLKRISRGMKVDRKAEMKQAEKYRDAVKIKTPSLNQLVSNLSGGNQQKVVVSKVLAIEPEILIFDEPTRGIDVGARYDIYTMMIDLTKQGKSIIMVSSDMEELLGMSERIIVLHEGEQTGHLTRDEFSQERILEYASGIK